MTEPTLVDALSSALSDAMRSALPDGPAVALVGFPSHANPGDSAIWLGAVAGLAALGRRVAYACDFHTYDRSALRRAVGSGPIVITGGGNFGDLYPEEQALRERVVGDFPDHPIVQLPQSIHFGDPDAARRAGDVLRAHRASVWMVRDRRSLRLAEEVLGVEAVLAPDCAFLLGALPRAGAPVRPVTIVRRRDVESVASDVEVGGSLVHDWMDEPAGWLQRVALRLKHVARDHPSLRATVGRLTSLTHGPLARRRLRRGVDLLSSGRVVVTDRLHGHVLSLMLGIPHVVTDTAQGKISAFLETWTGDSDLVRRAPDLQAAWATARRWDERLDRRAPR